MCSSDLYRLVRVDPDSEQRWTGYASALLAFSFLSVVLLYLLQRLQGLLPLSLGRGPVDAGIAFNTAISFVTNTNWQSYVPETVMRLATPQSAILSAVVFNALIIVALIPLALRGVRYRPTSAAHLLRRNLLIYGLGGVVVPFIGIFLIDLVVRYIPGI